MAETLRELEDLTDEELVERHDRTVRNTEFLDDFYLRVLNWRHQERLTKQIRCLTVFIAVLTFFVTIATVINVGILIYDVLK